jgi:hypothetical protein
LLVQTDLPPSQWHSQDPRLGAVHQSLLPQLFGCAIVLFPLLLFCDWIGTRRYSRQFP